MLAREPYERVQRMHWRLLVTKGWNPSLGKLAGMPMPDTIHGPDRLTFFREREKAQRHINAIFPPDPKPED